MEKTIKEKEAGCTNNIDKTNPRAGLRGELLQGEGEYHRLDKDWDDLFARTKDAPVYLSRPWVQTFVDQKRFKGNPSLIAVWFDTKLVALLPFSVHSKCGIRIGKPIGITEPSYLGILLDPDYTGAVAVAADIWNREKVAHVFDNKYLSSLDKATHKFITELHHQGFTYKSGYKRICHYIALGCSFDEYFNKFKSSKSRQTLLRKERKLYKNKELRFEYYSGDKVTSQILKRIVQIQKESWMKRRGAAVLGQPFYQNLLTNMAEAGLNSVWLMTINGDDAAFVYTLKTHGKLYYRWPAFKLKYESGLSIGQILLMRIIQDACKENVLSFDFGLGDAEYKRFWANKTHTVSWVVAGRGLHGHIVVLCYRIAWWFAGHKQFFSLYRRFKKRCNLLRPRSHTKTG